MGSEGEGGVCVNLGVLGHVDCGKTSLCKVLSTQGSTAAFDSNPQSKERGITLDLGFSTFPLKGSKGDYNITLVDCPGHASLIRTVLGGVRIMDLMVLVVDVTKGMQPQTWECLVLASITCRSLVVALNKVDLIPEEGRDQKIQKIKTLMQSTLKKMNFEPQPIVCASALSSSEGSSDGVEGLKKAILEKLEKTEFNRDKESPLVMAVDHCFNIKGSGSVCTGTVLQGEVRVNDNIEFPELQQIKKVKTMQVFKKPVDLAKAGDRVALGIPGLDAKQMERGIICAPKFIPLPAKAVVAKVKKISFFKGSVSSGKRWHVSVGYSTVTATVTFFTPENEEEKDFDRKKHYLLQDILDQDKEQFALLEFDKPVFILPHTLLIASNLQQLDDALPCRLSFHGGVVESCEDKDYKDTYLPTLNIFWYKKKTGIVDRVHSTDVLIVKGFCQKQSNIDHLLGLKVVIISGETDGEKNKENNNNLELTGRIEGRFGQTNKVRVALTNPLTDDETTYVKTHPCIVNLTYKKYKFRGKGGSDRKLCQ